MRLPPDFSLLSIGTPRVRPAPASDTPTHNFFAIATLQRARTAALTCPCCVRWPRTDLNGGVAAEPTDSCWVAQLTSYYDGGSSRAAPASDTPTHNFSVVWTLQRARTAALTCPCCVRWPRTDLNGGVAAEPTDSCWVAQLTSYYDGGSSRAAPASDTPTHNFSVVWTLQRARTAALTCPCCVWWPRTDLNGGVVS